MNPDSQEKGHYWPPAASIHYGSIGMDQEQLLSKTSKMARDKLIVRTGVEITQNHWVE